MMDDGYRYEYWNKNTSTPAKSSLVQAPKSRKVTNDFTSTTITFERQKEARRMSRILLLLSTFLLTEAWVPKGSVVHVDRLFVTQLAGQPRFAQANTERKKFRGDSKLAENYKEKINTAGRKGTKRFVDPCKVFVGNLPFSVDEEGLSRFVLDTMGQSRLILHQSKVISDWKTGKSKGYGFIVFTDPIYASVCEEVVGGKMLDGRALTVSQGKKKEQENQLYLKKKRKEPLSEEDSAIASALEEAESDEVDEDGIPVFGVSDEDLELDAMLFGMAASDEDDDDYDGIFLERKPIYEDMDPDLNREQRRKAAKAMKKTKLPSKGFGT
jgi:RNA recognition motif-containing protein